MTRIYLAELDVYDPVTLEETTLYFGTHGYTTGPAETPANIHFAARITQPALAVRGLYGRDVSYGEVATTYGELVLANADGALDAYVEYGFYGRQFRLWAGEDTDAFASFERCLTATMEQPLWQWETVSVILRDSSVLFDVPANDIQYLGTNSGGSGTEGTESDLKDVYKPRCWGTPYNVTPVLVNSSRLIYQVSTDAITTITAVYDRGAALTKGSDYTSAAQMESTAPTAGQYRVWPTDGMFRVGTTPSSITCDVNAGDAYLVNVVQEIAAEIAGISVEQATIDTLNELYPTTTVGIYAPDGVTKRDVLLWLAETAGGLWSFSRLGELVITVIQEPSVTAELTLTAASIIRLEPVTAPALPIWKGNLGWKRNWTVQQDFAGIAYYASGTVYTGSVNAAAGSQAEFASKEYRMATEEDSSVKVKYPNGPEAYWYTLIPTRALAEAECLRRFNLFKTRRDCFNIQVRLDESAVALLDLGDTLCVRVPRFGLAAGKNMRVIGMRTDYRTGAADLTVWG